jgi:hypothetical protein
MKTMVNNEALILFRFQEYLKDMGITVLGDIIAILKHAKQVQSRLTTDRALNQSNKQDRIKITSSVREPSVSSHDYSPAKELMEAANATSKESRTVKTTKLEGAAIDITTAKEKQGYGIFIIYKVLPTIVLYQ